VRILSTKRNGGTTPMSGTSMASPRGAGGAALYLSSHTGASPSTVESALKQAATTTSNKSKDGRTIAREWVADSEPSLARSRGRSRDRLRRRPADLPEMDDLLLANIDLVDTAEELGQGR
jgi:subtilisin family serine protease